MFILEKCTQLDQMCYNWKPVLIVFKYLIIVMQWSIPLLLIALGSFDMFKAMTRADKDEVVNAARSNLIKRIIYGLAIFLVPFFARLILNMVEENIVNEDYTSPLSWVSCWNKVMNDESFSDCEDIYKPTAEDAIHDDDSEDEDPQKKVCYVYYDYSCSGVDVRQPDSIDGAPTCRYPIIVDRDISDDNITFNDNFSYEALEQKCFDKHGHDKFSTIYPNRVSKRTLMCVYEPDKVEKGHTNMPTMNIPYKVYTCDSSINCETEYSLCKTKN